MTFATTGFIQVSRFERFTGNLTATRNGATHMSRTDKDRPYWVRCNDVTLLRTIHHDHRVLGKVLYKKVAVLDENGDTIPFDVPIYHDVFRDTAAQREGVTHAEACADYKKYAYLWRKEQFGSETYLEAEWVPYASYADHCTANEPLRHNRSSKSNDWDIKPCRAHLIEDYRRGTITKYYRQYRASQSRQKARLVQERYVKEFNSNGLEDFNDDDAQSHELPEIWW